MTQTKWLLRRLANPAWVLVAWLGIVGDAAADLTLSVNPERIREDAGVTEVAVKVENDVAVDADTYVLLGISQDGLNTRFRIQLTVLRILAGEKEASGTLTFIPIDDDIVYDDLEIEINGNAGPSETVHGTIITLIDDDKPSQTISLSTNIVEINRFADAVNVTVTATLDGKVLDDAVSFPLVIGDHPDLDDVPNADTNGDGAIDDDDATETNREAQRDLDYFVRLTSLTIPRGSVSGTATITITPDNRLPGTIRVQAPDRDGNASGIQIAADGLTLNPVDIYIKKEALATPAAITLSHDRIREDAGATTVELKISLTSTLIEAETVRLAVLPAGTSLPSGGTVPSDTPIRDVHYSLAFSSPLTIPAGASEGTTTFTLTPTNDELASSRGLIYIRVTVGNEVAIRTIAIADDDANSETISLTVNPTTINEGSPSTEVVVTGTLDGKVLNQDVVVLLTIDPDPKDTDADNNVVDVVEATRDVDYTATLRPVRIPAGSVSGTGTITIAPIDDGIDDPSETIRLTVPYANNQLSVGGLTLTVGTVDITLRDASEGGVPSFAADAAIPAQTYTIGRAIRSLVLPEATGEGSLTYTVSALPPGLVFDAATRTLTGTPTQAANVTITYIATDSDGDAATLSFAITITASAGTGVAFPAGTVIAPQTYPVGTEIPGLVLPAAMESDCYPAYSVSALPAGLWFNSATRTLAGTPTQTTDGAVLITYTAADVEMGASAQLTFSIQIDPAPTGPLAASLTATPSEISEAGARTVIELTFSLSSASESDETVRFAIVEPSAGTAAIRDADYRAELEVQLTIPAGATEGTVSLTLTPVNDANNEGEEALGVRASLLSTGETLVTDIKIKDDDAPSTAIELSADHTTLSEQDALTTITLTATLNGQPLAADATVRLAIDETASATRDLDYAALITPRIEIPAGSTTGTVKFYVDPIADGLTEGDEIIRVLGTIDGLTGDSVEITLRDGAGKVAVQPAAFALADNYPNPFNPATTIQYALPQAADVELTVYNVVGQPVRTLVAEHQNAGHYGVEWDATNDSGYSLPSGMYFYHLQAGDFRAVKKMLLLK